MTVSAVLGAGAWGTTFAKVLADAGGAVRLWTRRQALAGTIRRTRRNADYLPDLVLPPAVTPTADLREALYDAEMVVLAVPAQEVRAQLTAVAGALPPGVLLVSLAKGIELGTGARLSEVIAEVAGVSAMDVAVVSGPNLAAEVAAGQPSATVVACADEDRAKQLQVACATDYLRPYTNTDVIGCELGGAAKNVVALAVGMVAGMGYGDNSRAALMTRGLAETARLGQALGADPFTLAGLAGMGDLILTCTSPRSRNHACGRLLGAGLALPAAVAGAGGTVEGVTTSRALLTLAGRHGVDLPIVEHVVRVCHEGLPPRAAVAALMARETRSER